VVGGAVEHAEDVNLYVYYQSLWALEDVRWYIHLYGRFTAYLPNCSQAWRQDVWWVGSAKWWLE